MEVIIKEVCLGFIKREKFYVNNAYMSWPLLDYTDTVMVVPYSPGETSTVKFNLQHHILDRIRRYNSVKSLTIEDIDTVIVRNSGFSLTPIPSNKNSGHICGKWCLGTKAGMYCFLDSPDLRNKLPGYRCVVEIGLANFMDLFRKDSTFLRRDFFIDSPARSSTGCIATYGLPEVSSYVYQLRRLAGERFLNRRKYLTRPKNFIPGHVYAKSERDCMLFLGKFDRALTYTMSFNCSRTRTVEFGALDNYDLRIIQSTQTTPLYYFLPLFRSTWDPDRSNDTWWVDELTKSKYGGDLVEYVWDIHFDRGWRGYNTIRLMEDEVKSCIDCGLLKCVNFDSSLGSFNDQMKAKVNAALSKVDFSAIDPQKNFDSATWSLLKNVVVKFPEIINQSETIQKILLTGCISKIGSSDASHYCKVFTNYPFTLTEKQVQEIWSTI